MASREYSDFEKMKKVFKVFSAYLIIALAVCAPANAKENPALKQRELEIQSQIQKNAPLILIIKRMH